MSQQQPMPPGTSLSLESATGAGLQSLAGHHLADRNDGGKQTGKAKQRESANKRPPKSPPPLSDSLKHQGTQWARIRPETEGLPVQEQARRGGLGVCKGAMVAFAVDPLSPSWVVATGQSHSHAQQLQQAPGSCHKRVYGLTYLECLCLEKKKNTGVMYFPELDKEGHKEN